MQITKKLEWDMGHRIPNHKSKCKNLHGHRYVIYITLSGEIIDEKGISEEGMIIDFSDIKNIAKKFIDEKLDHGFMFYEKDKELSEFFNKNKNFKFIKVDFVPTAENIVNWIFKELNLLFIDKCNNELKLEKIKLYETPNSFVEINYGKY